MKANLVKELESSLVKRKHSADQNDVLKEAQKLIENDGHKDIALLRNIGGASSLVQSENEKGRMLEIERKEKFYSGKIFSKDQIIKLAVKYRLKFLQSCHYTKYIDPAIIPEIRDMERSISESMTQERAMRENVSVEEFIEKNGGAIKHSIDDHSLQTKFYILAPANCFKTEKSQVFTIKQPDPVMFYSDDNQHFRLIKKWGSDFTILRRVLGFFTRSLFNHIFFMYFLPLTLLVLFSGIFITKYAFTGYFPIGVFSLVFLFNGIDVDDHFSGKEYTTSLKSYYV